MELEVGIIAMFKSHPTGSSGCIAFIPLNPQQRKDNDMIKKILPLLTSSVIVSGVISMPAHASLQGALQRGQTQSIEATLEPGQYILYIIAKDATTQGAAAASLTVSETNGKLIRKSEQLPPVLQINDNTKQGAVLDIRRTQTVRLVVQMDVCRMLCGFAVVPVRSDSGRLGVVDLPTKPVSKRPSGASTANNAKPREQSNPPTRPPDVSDRQKTYVFQTNSYINTGLSVNPGDRIKIQASGRVRFGFIAGSGGPKGIAFNPDYNLFFSRPHGELMGRLRRSGMGALDGWMTVGEGGEMVAKTPGVLEFAVNDTNPGDNVGNFQIEVTINAAR